MQSLKMDWLRMEDRMRTVLRQFEHEQITAAEAMSRMDNILGEETGRGFELKPNPRTR